MFAAADPFRIRAKTIEPHPRGQDGLEEWHQRVPVSTFETWTALQITSLFEDRVCPTCKATVRRINTEGYRALLRAQAAEAIAKLKGRISGRRLEKLLRISQGYLSRVSGKGTPSELLVALLVLLAANPILVGELEQYWTALLPVTDG
jgi:hypothetical protein